MSYGFFKDEELDKPDLSFTYTIAKCGACKLYKDCSTPKMKAVGKGKKKILIIGEHPTKREDSTGRALSGKANAHLKLALREAGIDLKIDCKKINACSCYGEKIADKHIIYCRANIIKTIKKFKPKVIILLGKGAVTSVIGSVWKKNLGEIDKWRGNCIPDRHFNCWITTSFCPSFITWDKQNPVMDLIFKKDIKVACGLRNHDLPVFEDVKKRVKVLTEYEDIKKLLKHILKKKPLFAFDYETDGLKPHAKGHKVYTASICYDTDKAYAFPLLNNRIKTLFKQILADESIKKIAQNMTFEVMWSETALKAPVNGLLWDTMLATHVLDNRRGITGLKFQVYVNFGIADYDSSIEKYLKSKEKNNANSFNYIHRADRITLLIYNALDSYFTYKLAIMQMKQFGILDAQRFANKGNKKIESDIHIINTFNPDEIANKLVAKKGIRL